MGDRLSQLEMERLELQALEARKWFLDALSRAPEARRAYADLQRIERQVLEGKRARREAEVHGA